MLECEYSNTDLIDFIESFGFKQYALKNKMKNHLIPNMGNILFYR